MFKNFREEQEKINERILLEVKINDTINVRGNGKFIVDRISHITKREKISLIIKKHV